MRRLAKTEAGFGLVELLIAMTVMVIAIMAIVAAFSSGLVALKGASRASTAATVADKQMEAYRAIRWNNVVLKQTLFATALTDSVYANDTALAGGAAPVTDALSGSYCNPTPTPVTCLPTQSPVTGPDGGSYRIDSYVTWTCPVGTFSTASPYTTAAPGCTGGA